MIAVQIVDRKSSVLTPSTLACLRQVATINLTAGCVHDCLYCHVPPMWTQRDTSETRNRILQQVSEILWQFGGLLSTASVGGDGTDRTNAKHTSDVPLKAVEEEFGCETSFR